MRFSDWSGHWEFNPFPGCSQIIVSNHAYVKPKHRGVGIGSAKNEARVKQATRLGYDMMLCTVRSDNREQIRILQTNSWKCLTKFTNRESGHEVQLWCHHLDYKHGDS